MSNDENTLRSLIRLIAPAKALKEGIEQAQVMGHAEGAGEFALQSYQGLHESVKGLVQDRYVDSLAVQLPDDAPDSKKLAVVGLASGQLLAYLQAQTGVPTGGSGGFNYNRNVMTNVSLPKEAIEKLIE